MKCLLSLGLLLALYGCAGGIDDASLPGDGAYSWQAEQIGTAEYDMPITEIALVDASGVEHYKTTCEGSASTEAIEGENIATSLSCWFAGGGTDYAVMREEGGDLGIYTRWTDEVSGFGEWERVQW